MEVGKAVEQLWPGKSLSCISNVPYPDGLFFLSLFFFSCQCRLPNYYIIYLFYCLSLLARMAAT